MTYTTLSVMHTDVSAALPVVRAVACRDDTCLQLLVTCNQPCNAGCGSCTVVMASVHMSQHPHQLRSSSDSSYASSIFSSLFSIQGGPLRCRCKWLEVSLSRALSGCMGRDNLVCGAVLESANLNMYLSCQFGTSTLVLPILS